MPRRVFAGLVDHVQEAALAPRAGGHLIAIPYVGEDPHAYYGYPGDVEYPKSSWRLVTFGRSYTVAEYARLESEAFGRSVGAR